MSTHRLHHFRLFARRSDEGIVTTGYWQRSPGSTGELSPGPAGVPRIAVCPTGVELAEAQPCGGDPSTDPTLGVLTAYGVLMAEGMAGGRYFKIDWDGQPRVVQQELFRDARSAQVWTDVPALKADDLAPMLTTAQETPEHITFPDGSVALPLSPAVFMEVAGVSLPSAQPPASFSIDAVSRMTTGGLKQGPPLRVLMFAPSCPTVLWDASIRSMVLGPEGWHFSDTSLIEASWICQVLKRRRPEQCVFTVRLLSAAGVPSRISVWVDDPAEAPERVAVGGALSLESSELIGQEETS